MGPEAEWEAFDDEWTDDDRPSPWPVTQLSRGWQMVYRAIAIYVGLTLGLAIVITLLGGNPIAYDWFMPRMLLYIVGLALLIALGNAQLYDQGYSVATWLDGQPGVDQRRKRAEK